MVKSPHHNKNNRAGFGRRGPVFEVNCSKLAVTLVHYIFPEILFTWFPPHMLFIVSHGVSFDSLFLVALFIVGSCLAGVDVDDLVYMVPESSPWVHICIVFLTPHFQFSCVVFRWLLSPVKLVLQLLWPELATVLSGPCLVRLKLYWHKSTVLSHPFLKKLLSLSCPVHSKNRVVPWQHDWHARILYVYSLNTTFTLSIYTITGKMFWNLSVSFPRLDSHTSLCKHLCIL